MQQNQQIPPKIIIVGTGETAELAFEYFSYDSSFEVVAFAVEKKFITEPKFMELPVVDFEELDSLFSPQTHSAFVAVGYGNLNRLRSRLVRLCREKGFSLASYISSRAFVWHNATVGENCFILENNVLQYNVSIGNNVYLWSGNHIGHRAVIRDNVFISSHVVISGYAEIGENTFMGVNSSVADHTIIARDNVISAGAVVLSDTEQGKVYRGNPAEAASLSSYKIFGVRSNQI